MNSDLVLDYSWCFLSLSFTCLVFSCSANSIIQNSLISREDQRKAFPEFRGEMSKFSTSFVTHKHKVFDSTLKLFSSFLQPPPGNICILVYSEAFSMLLYTLPNAASFCRAKFLTRRKNCVAGDDTLASSQSFEIPLHCGESFFAPRLTPSQEIKILKKTTKLFSFFIHSQKIRETTCIILLLEHNLHRPCHHFRVYFSFLIFPFSLLLCVRLFYSLFFICFGGAVLGPTVRPTPTHSSHFAFADEGGCDQDYKVELCRVFIIFVLEVFFCCFCCCSSLAVVCLYFCYCCATLCYAVWWTRITVIRSIQLLPIQFSPFFM